MSRATKAIIGLFLATSVAMGQSNLLPIVRGETVLHRGGSSQIKVSHNDYDTVAKEIHEPEFRKLLIQILKLREDAPIRYAIGKGYNIQVSSMGLNDSAESLAVVLGDYVRSRAEGHTANYALDSLKQRLREFSIETNGFRATLFKSFPHLPRHWVKEDPFPSPALSVDDMDQQFVVIDGDIAWTYSVPLGTGRVLESRVDAQEFDPKLRPKFDAARQEAEQNLEKRGIKKGYGYALHAEAELNSILLQKYQIKRRGFRELNPGMVVH